jgi:hypothetical protein
MHGSEWAGGGATFLLTPSNGEAERPRAAGVKWTDEPGISFPFHQNEAARRGDAAVCNEEEASRAG